VKPTPLPHCQRDWELGCDLRRHRDLNGGTLDKAARKVAHKRRLCSGSTGGRAGRPRCPTLQDLDDALIALGDDKPKSVQPVQVVRNVSSEHPEHPGVRLTGLDGKSCPRKPDPELPGRIKEMRAESYTVREIARALGCSVSSAHRRSHLPIVPELSWPVSPESENTL
jgi:hypothetical protein